MRLPAIIMGVLLIVCCARAQHREVGLSLGIGIPGRFIEGLESWPGFALSAKVFTMVDQHLQAGITLDKHQLLMRQVFDYGYINEPEQVYYYDFGRPLLTIAGVVNYRVPVRRHYLYLGPTGGYASSKVRDPLTNYRKGRGLMVGAQAGGVFAWGGGPLAVAFELSPRYYLMTWELIRPNSWGKTEDRYVSEWNATVGLRYLF